MAKKIFVSHKHADNAVRRFSPYVPATVRDYVNELERRFVGDYIYKGEKDGEDLGAFKDETIESHLRDKIFDSSVTIVLISKNMKEFMTAEEDQWIPWEISYSLREKTRDDRTSSANAMLAVVIPDENGSYEYFVESLGCPNCNGVSWKTNTLFSILDKNMFNRKKPNMIACSHGTLHANDDHSYIYPVHWDEFIPNINRYIDLATKINQNINDYEVVVQIPVKGKIPQV